MSNRIIHLTKPLERRRNVMLNLGDVDRAVVQRFKAWCYSRGCTMNHEIIRLMREAMDES